MELNTLFYLSILLFSGLFSSRIIRYLNLPDVTGYLVVGLLIGPSVLGVIPEHVVDGLSLVSSVSLGFIAFSIGGEFKLSYFRRVGIAPVVIAAFESFFAVFFVVSGLLIVGQTLPFALVLGAIAAATAPAATIMVIKQYRAEGPVTETLLSVVAIDDAMALIAFGICVAIAEAMNSQSDVALLVSLIIPIIEILAALVIGGALGAVYAFVIRFVKSSSSKMILTIAFVLVTTAVADKIGLSALLMTMTMGAVFANLYKNSLDVIELCDNVTPPIFMMFFVLSGAGLNISVLPSVGLVGVVYIVLRVVGKLIGAWAGASVTRSDSKVRKWLGPALLPQAGVAIGLTVVAQSVVPHYAEQIRAVILCATLIYELFGPGVSKWTLKKAGEIKG